MSSWVPAGNSARSGRSKVHIGSSLSHELHVLRLIGIDFNLREVQILEMRFLATTLAISVQNGSLEPLFSFLLCEEGTQGLLELKGCMVRLVFGLLSLVR